MTDTAAPPATLSDTAVRLATAPGATISSFLAGLAQGGAVAKETPKVALPKQVNVTADQRLALAELAELAGKIGWPTEHRALSDGERDQLGTFLTKVKIVKKLVADSEAALRTTLFNDFDVRAEIAGRVDDTTPRDDNGHYLIPDVGPGYAREPKAGTPTTDTDVLRDLVEKGDLEHSDFVAATVATRVIEQGRFLRLIGKKPHLLSTLSRGIRYARAASASLVTK
jgi:hypothetical protein